MALRARHRYLYNNFGKLLSEVGVAQTIYDECHHNIIYGSINLNIPLPPPYYRGVSNYKNTDPICIQHTVLVN